jgi:hypothetical protein
MRALIIIVLMAHVTTSLRDITLVTDSLVSSQKCMTLIFLALLP